MAGGGTGGHVLPALAVARELRARGQQVRFVGVERGMEAKLVPAENFPIAPHLKHLYAHLLENRFVQSVQKFDASLLPIRSRAVLENIRSGTAGWEQNVPERIVEIIKRESLFGYQPMATNAV